ncbi:hypothetical protein C8Z91_12055 [Paenibacillus elgii]|uniref:Uncharacterized protein n=1 Tax=Paenibacillus elgii TaxID=189691 RepID=A0A2T6G3S3_9BACL|nr:hypothetical protein [Paenibacillus elgii]PUA38811.1 hypothetical protein C8Z91_12055 [Paenibacillus elgii]
MHQYVVTLYLLKALERDRKHAEAMKLSRIWGGLFERLLLLAEREHNHVKQRLRRSGCRIVLEEVTPERHYHVMYVFQWLRVSLLHDAYRTEGQMRRKAAGAP